MPIDDGGVWGDRRGGRARLLSLIARRSVELGGPGGVARDTFGIDPHGKHPRGPGKEAKWPERSPLALSCRSRWRPRRDFGFAYREVRPPEPRLTRSQHTACSGATTRPDRTSAWNSSTALRRSVPYASAKVLWQPCGWENDTRSNLRNVASPFGSICLSARESRLSVPRMHR
jgi:hypothetical protein